MKIKTIGIAIAGAMSSAMLLFGLITFSPSTSTSQPKSPASAPTPTVATATTPATQRSKQPASHASMGMRRVANKTAAASSEKSLTTAVTAKRQGTVAIAHGKTYPVRSYKALMMPNDPSANQAWVQAINMPAAWDIPRGSTPTTIAVIDTGFALNHEELQGRFATNAGEQGPTTSEAPSELNCTDKSLPLDESCNLIDDDGDGIVDNESGPATEENPSRLNCTDQHIALDKSCNLIDDDGNGYVDDVHGWDFVHEDNSPQAGESDPNTTGGHHATYVSSTAAATGNNGKGIAGVDWNAKILPIQALDDDGDGNTLAVANGIVYAADQHADVINLSLGADADDPLVHWAVQYAEAAGSVVVAAAGNDGCGCMSYPANYPEALAVGAAFSNGTPASFSSYGPNLDILAPGVNLYTADWTPSNQTSAYASNISGTSLATPIISGLVSRLKSEQPTATPLQLMAAIAETATRTGLPAGVSRSDTTGFGFVNAAAASQRLATAVSPVQRYAFGSLSLGNKYDAASPSEGKIGGYVYQCDGSSPGTTPIYELKNGSDSFFTASNAEQQAALSNGYTSNFFAYGCMSQPQDHPTMMRSIDLKREFRNTNSKQ